jgi:uncharacterized cupredoxin-like copper-binding protein
VKAIAAVALTLAAAACGGSQGTVDVAIRYSRFEPARIEVPAGTTVTFTVRNEDPIAHEFIIGTLAEQAEHERGTEQTHDGAPGAASLAPGEMQTVSYAFAEPGALEFACHLPGHYGYGMRGTIDVV